MAEATVRARVTTPTAGRAQRWSGAAALGFTCLTVVLWLLAAAGPGLPRRLSEWVVLLTLVAVGAWCAVTVARLWRPLAEPGGAVLRSGAWSRADGRILLVLLVLSLVVRLAGIGFEAEQNYYRDEGIYRAAAVRINHGELLPRSFIYGHLSHYLAAFAMWLWPLVPLGAGASLEPTVAVRSIAVLAGALTTWPVFAAAHRIAGRRGAVLAALLVIASPVYNEVAHVYISDVPAAFFATLCLMFTARLLDGERTRDYVLAGIAAGLAAGCKYPAGVAAIGIVGIWLYWRSRGRRLVPERGGWGIAWAGLAAVATFLAVMPALVPSFGLAFAGSGKDILFGFRQYARGGWIGVQPESDAFWYGRVIAANFGWPALVAGLGGSALLAPVARRRLLLLMVFPAAYLALLLAMSMVVKRNLQPVLPALAVLLGAGLAGWLDRRPLAGRRWAPAALAVVCLAAPALATLSQAVSWSRASTRELMASWMAQNLPVGTTVVKESYTPSLSRQRFAVRQTRFAARYQPAELRDPRHDVLLLAAPAFERFLDPANFSEEHHERFSERYREYLSLPRIAEFSPGRWREGPRLVLFRLDPRRIAWRRARNFDSRAAFVSQLDRRAVRRGDVIRFVRSGQLAVFKEYLAAGRYRLRLDAEPPARRSAGPGELVVRTRDNREVARTALSPGGVEIDLPSRDKYLLQLALPRGSVLRGLVIEAERKRRAQADAETPEEEARLPWGG